jgi:hypothetical protein
MLPARSGFPARAAPVYGRTMANQELTQAVKRIIGIGKSESLDAAYQAYAELFSSPSFLENRPEDQRTALRLMILVKGAPNRPTPAMLEAHRAAVAPLTELVSTLKEPADHELLGVCHVVLGNEQAADVIFRTGLNLERERSPQSDLCGALMKRISLL